MISASSRRGSWLSVTVGGPEVTTMLRPDMATHARGDATRRRDLSTGSERSVDEAVVRPLRGTRLLEDDVEAGELRCAIDLAVAGLRVRKEVISGAGRIGSGEDRRLRRHARIGIGHE